MGQIPDLRRAMFPFPTSRFHSTCLLCSTSICVKVLTWWLLDKLTLLLLVTRDEVEDVDDPPTGWPRDKPEFVYDEWDDPNGLWKEHINIHKGGGVTPSGCQGKGKVVPVLN
jgi:hypothetical protein